MANPRTNQSNQSCCLCGISEAVQLCPCKATTQLFCDSCVHKHFVESRSHCHQILPIDTLPYYQLPGYIKQYRERTGVKYENAIKTLHGNLGEIDRWKSAVIDSTATIVKSLTDHSNSVVAVLEALKVKLEFAITEGVREAEEAVFEPSPVLNSRIARGLRNCEEMNLVMCRTDFAEVIRQFEELVKTYVVSLQVEIPAFIPDEQPQGKEIRTVVISEKSLDRVGNIPESYIGERDEKSRKNGYGKMRLSDGTVIETHWKFDKPCGTGKCLSDSHSFFVGDCNEYLNRNRRKSKRWIEIALLGVIVAMAVSRGESDCELRSRGPTETETGAYTGQWNIRNEFQGFGMMRYSDSDVLAYKGQWVNGTKFGRGKETYKDGSEYEGDFVNGTRQGYGEYMSSVSNYSYLGTWKRNMKDGFGYESNKTESGEETVYIGEFFDGKQTGKGVHYVEWSAANEAQIDSIYSAANILSYQAYWVNGNEIGTGIIEYTDGSKYHGGVINVMKHGYGVYIRGVDNSTYLGDWENDLKHGFGIEDIETEEGERIIYIGLFAKGERAGEGVQYVKWKADKEIQVESRYSSANIFSYKGYWVNGEEVGKGWIEYTDGSKYEGGIIKVMKHGCGGYTSGVDNSTYLGLWGNDLKDVVGIEINYTEEGARKMYIGGFVKGKWSEKGVHYVEWNADNETQLESHYSAANILSFRTYQVIGDVRKASIAYKDGSYYIGELLNEKRHGFGVYKSTMDNSLYQGFWDNDLKHVFGHESINSTDEGEGKLYIGEFVKGNRAGKGVHYVQWNAANKTQVESRYSAADILSYEAYEVNGAVSIGAITYRDGSNYTGQLLNERRHGYGVYVNIVDNSTHIGGWKNDVKHEYGIEMNYTKKGERNMYLGVFQQGKRSGRGVLYVDWNTAKDTQAKLNKFAANVLSYQSYQVNDQVCKGRIEYRDGSHYTGELLDEMRDGYGTYINDVDNSVYQGGWEKDLKHAFGNETSYTKEGERKVYIGLFVKGKRAGKGVHYVEWNATKDTQAISSYSVANIFSYKIYQVNGEVSKGEIKYIDGSYYRGELLNEKRHGYGVYKKESDIYYSGTWDNNVKDGIGMEIIMITEGKSIWYVGEFAGGKRKGMGATFTDSYPVSVGYWKDSFVFGIRYEIDSLCIGDVLNNKDWSCRPFGENSLVIGQPSLRSVPKYFYGKVDAITIRVSKTIILTSLQFPGNSNCYLTIQSLDIIEGGSTKGKILYTHSSQSNVHSKYEEVVINTKKEVKMEATHTYTIRVVLSGSCQSSISSIPSILDDGFLKISKPVFGGDDQDNDPSSTWVIFSAINYRRLYYYDKLNE